MAFNSLYDAGGQSCTCQATKGYINRGHQTVFHFQQGFGPTLRGPALPLHQRGRRRVPLFGGAHVGASNL